jgi:hypothetical protein
MMKSLFVLLFAALLAPALALAQHKPEKQGKGPAATGEEHGKGQLKPHQPGNQDKKDDNGDDKVKPGDEAKPHKPPMPPHKPPMPPEKKPMPVKPGTPEKGDDVLAPKPPMHKPLPPVETKKPLPVKPGEPAKPEKGDNPGLHKGQLKDNPGLHKGQEKPGKPEEKKDK